MRRHKDWVAAAIQRGPCPTAGASPGIDAQRGLPVFFFHYFFEFHGLPLSDSVFLNELHDTRPDFIAGMAHHCPMFIPTSFMTATASGSSVDALAPALNASNRTPATSRKKRFHHLRSAAVI